MYKRQFFLLLLLVNLSCLVHGQSVVQWTAFEHLNDSLRNEKKPLMIFIHTEWCKYCDMQENIVFQQAKIASLLSQNFYCLRLEAEGSDEIKFLNRRYAFQSGSGYHQLAELLGKKNGSLIFPTTVLVNKDLQIYTRLQGLQTAADLQSVLTQ